VSRFIVARCSVAFASLAVLGFLEGCLSPGLPTDPGAIRWIDRRVVVKFKQTADPVRVDSARVKIGARTWERLPMTETDLLELDGALDVPSALEKLNDFGDVVEYAEPDFLYQASGTPSDYDSTLLWGMAKIDVADAWQETTGSASVIVAVIDTGIDATHPDLTSNVWTNPGELLNGVDDDGDGFVDDRHGWNFVNGTADPVDDVGHGTHVSGTIGAVGGNGGIVGISPKVTIMPLKTIGPDGGSASDAVKAIAFARTHGARIINASWGGRGYSNALKQAISNAGAAGVLFVAAAGNGDAAGNGLDADRSPTFPAAFGLPSIIAVAASDKHDHLASFSNYGLTSIDLAAPGVGITSTIPGSLYARYDGTSMAAPHVSGAAALLLAAEPGLGMRELRAALIDSALPIPALSGRLASGGRLDASRALAAAHATAHGSKAP
jgi:subtilisin family serine protease